MTQQLLLFTVDVNADTNMVLADRKLGILKFSDQCLHDEQLEGELMLIFSRLIPVDCKHDFSVQVTRFLCLSPLFDPVGLGNVIPEYLAIITRDPNAPTTVHFLKQGSTVPSTVQQWPFPTGATSPAIAGSGSNSGSTGTSQPDTITPGDSGIDFSTDATLDDAGCVKDSAPAPKRFDTIKDMFK